MCINRVNKLISVVVSMYRSWASGLVGVWNLIGTNNRVYDLGRAWQLYSSPNKKMEKTTLLSDTFCHFSTRIENFLDFLKV